MQIFKNVTLLWIVIILLFCLNIYLYERTIDKAVTIAYHGDSISLLTEQRDCLAYLINSGNFGLNEAKLRSIYNDTSMYYIFWKDDSTFVVDDVRFIFADSSVKYVDVKYD